ncbi:uncharacterized protein PHALS_04821 [Plasmopara halstedii]|uniref:Uncharacterized protein n=1 Tax=Plasmopara halstedii TaxID=4781 RepID=A0A0P1B2I9_PLAHL|nr:uncharacterized protein PHALS_04821 [Plasmopara halstedii]CEG47674.1 hypothetical protein PHALS_04821 [Plasmopara halstedii]|eukprot:XP_024584043.1 hypothetical protein PHALS_04821 [Plasmopara halstedii]
MVKRNLVQAPATFLDILGSDSLKLNSLSEAVQQEIAPYDSSVNYISITAVDELALVLLRGPDDQMFAIHATCAKFGYIKSEKDNMRSDSCFYYMFDAAYNGRRSFMQSSFYQERQDKSLGLRR